MSWVNHAFVEVTLKQQSTVWKGSSGRNGQVKILTVSAAVMQPALENGQNTEDIILRSGNVK